MKYLSATSIDGKYTIDPPGYIPSGGMGQLTTILSNGIDLLFVVAIIFALIMIVFAGIQWISSGGEKEKIEGARKRIIFSIIGLIIIFLSFFIVNVIGGLFGVKLITP